jgi:hypothetical protein
MPKYNNIENIPAKVFFKILDTKDYQLLKPKPSEKDLDAVFLSIYDDFFNEMDNPLAKRFLTLSNQITALKSEREMLKYSLSFIFVHKHLMTEKMVNDWLDVLGLDNEGDVYDKIQYGMTFKIGEIDNDLVFLETEMEDFKKGETKSFNFFKQLATISTTHKMQLNQDISLAEFVAYQKIIKS